MDAKNIYFLGIGGTGMAAVAGLAQQAGYNVSGSDNPIYPPMSTLLDELKINVNTPYSKDNFNNNNADLVIVANALSRGHEELEYMLEKNYKYTSFPQFLGEYFLETRQSIVVTGTHGKTTTSSVISKALIELGENPGYFIGGIPKGFTKSFELGTGPCFVLEGDEYDTAFFDKNSKFLHYKPNYIIFNNLEFDHADIFDSIEDIEHQFTLLFEKIGNKKNIIANVDDEGVRRLLIKLNLLDKVTTVSTKGLDRSANVVVNSFEAVNDKDWQLNLEIDEQKYSLRSCLTGTHNMANIAQVVALLLELKRDQKISPNHSIENILNAISSFEGVARRMDKLGQVSQTEIYEDFAHHPTAVKLVIDGFKKTHPNKRLLVAFEPKNATSRRSIFTDEYVDAFKDADKVFIGACPLDKRIDEKNRMDTHVLVDRIGKKAQAFLKNDELLDAIVSESINGDAIIFMSSGSFSGVQYKAQEKLEKKLLSDGCS